MLLISFQLPILNNTTLNFKHQFMSNSTLNFHQDLKLAPSFSRLWQHKQFLWIKEMKSPHHHSGSLHLPPHFWLQQQRYPHWHGAPPFSSPQSTSTPNTQNLIWVIVHLLRHKTLLQLEERTHTKGQGCCIMALTFPLFSRFVYYPWLLLSQNGDYGSLWKFELKWFQLIFTFLGVLQ